MIYISSNHFTNNAIFAGYNFINHALLAAVTKHPIPRIYKIRNFYFMICRKPFKIIQFISLGTRNVNKSSNHELNIFLFLSKFYQDCQLLPLLLLDNDHCFFPSEVNLVLLNPYFHNHL